VTPVSEIGPYRFTIGDITRTLMDDYTALTHPAHSVAAAGSYFLTHSLTASMLKSAHGAGE
jgi:hypothetical protein